jgi:hypothetical protein
MRPGCRAGLSWSTWLASWTGKEYTLLIDASIIASRRYPESGRHFHVTPGDFIQSLPGYQLVQRLNQCLQLGHLPVIRVKVRPAHL